MSLRQEVPRGPRLPHQTRGPKFSEKPLRPRHSRAEPLPPRRRPSARSIRRLRSQGTGRPMLRASLRPPRTLCLRPPEAERKSSAGHHPSQSRRHPLLTGRRSSGPSRYRHNRNRRRRPTGRRFLERHRSRPTPNRRRRLAGRRSSEGHRSRPIPNRRRRLAGRRSSEGHRSRPTPNRRRRLAGRRFSEGSRRRHSRRRPRPAGRRFSADHRHRQRRHPEPARPRSSVRPDRALPTRNRYPMSPVRPPIRTSAPSHLQLSPRRRPSRRRVVPECSAPRRLPHGLVPLPPQTRLAQALSPPVPSLGDPRVSAWHLRSEPLRRLWLPPVPEQSSLGCRPSPPACGPAASCFHQRGPAPRRRPFRGSWTLGARAARMP